ncbi:hypothetical protein CcI49_14905 [Frankia sp. CcI49]|uniref:pyridoxal phosphate-dependent aminotransferase n=1 Tax=unclassified Frankia TaxID=2632575 RepID=UPI0006CA2419|nr:MULTISPECIES: pyridoxal phosphate-dependent aminotransferase [unclassified Frankia]KPM52316.1 hypothetical protein ACG83_28360 [Frankia sp. R43]ONH59989.1 hypothetical protein CcI49_14905 [Frankia sp. CcI49]
MRNLTEREAAVLAAADNLADGHAYRTPSPTEAAILRSAGEMLLSVDRRDLATLEGEYLQAFFALGHQSLDPSAFSVFQCLSASMALEIIGNYCRLARISVSLVEPCFDNLSDILKRHGVPLRPIPDALFADPAALIRRLEEDQCDAVLLVSPNNPSGRHLSEAAFRAVVDHCAHHRKIFALDACFRFYLPEEHVYDQYALLAASGADWVVVEDTGKTWPTQEVKAPFFAASRSLASSLGAIYSDFLLLGSPFAMRLLTELVRASSDDGLDSVRRIVRSNREVLDACLAGTALRSVGESFMSVSWLAVEPPATAEEFCALLARRGVHVLPGGPFFWSDPTQGARFLRVSLVRDPESFRRSAEVIAQTCRARAEV